MAEPGTRVFYRVVRTNPPSLVDFMSNEALGRRPRRAMSERDRDRWRGVSHFDSPQLASFTARASPWLGPFVATVVLRPWASIRWQEHECPACASPTAWLMH